jgi:hypothetical protein
VKPRDPHGAAPERAKTVLPLVDVINDLDFPDGEKPLRFALPAARRIAVLKKRLRKSGVPSIYVNDNFGRWQPVAAHRLKLVLCHKTGCGSAW